MNVLKKKQFNTSKGFTLVELIVVLVLMTILVSLTIGGILTWQDWSRFKKENTSAETIFYALQSQFTELDTTDAFTSTVTKPVQSVKNLSEDKLLFVADRTNQSWFSGSGTNKVTFDADSYYIWEPVDSQADNAFAIWANTPNTVASPDKKENYQGSIYYLSANKGDYDRYLNKEFDTATDEKKGTKLLFDLISPYISEKSVLNGAIWVEFSPEARQVFAVCYSDRVDSFAYAPASGSDTVSVLDRTEDTRRDALMGYYAADSLSISLKGRSAKALGNVYFDNKETFDLVIAEDKITEEDHFVIDVCPAYSDGTMDEDYPLMTLEVKLKNNAFEFNNGTTHSAVTNNNSFDSAFTNPAIVKVTFYEGYYASDDFKSFITNTPSKKNYFKGITDSKTNSFNMQIPAYIRDSSKYAGKKELVLILDAADIQAQSYLCADKNKPEPSFINTYSFYRFGFDLDKDKIMKVGAVLESETSDDYVVSENIESPVFADATVITENSVNKNQYKITNGRHLYNVRFETDYKENVYDNSGKLIFKANTYPREFVVASDIDWATFVKDSSNKNYFFDSYKSGAEMAKTDDSATTGNESGINYKLSVDDKKYINKSYTNTSNSYSTADCDFPGFRALGINDVFKAEANPNGGYYSISNLSISFSANIAYGVYGKDAAREWYGNDVANFNKYEGTNLESHSLDFANLNRFNTATGKEMHPTYEKVMRGLYPLGLFAENSGTITDLVLNDHRVVGMENLGDDANPILVFTNMVGGFTGNNLGEMSNLTLANDSDKTFVNGRTDVGGILGRESWTVASIGGTECSVTLSGLNNYGKVTGMENVGGVVGRAFLIREYVQASDVENSTKDYQAYYFRRLFYDDGYDIYGEFSDNGSYKSGSSLSITGRSVNRVTVLDINNCTSRGEVRGDDLIYKYVIELYENVVETQRVNGNTVGIEKYDCDLSNYTHQCANIGGIAGMTMDGAYYDCRNIGNPNVGNSIYENKWAATAQKEDRKLTLTNCNAYYLYSAGELNILNSSNGGKLPSGDIRNMLTYDYFVGGLVGYCKFTRIVDCSNNVDSAQAGERAFVFGRNYVGGLFGCFDFSKIEENKTFGGYSIVNNSNVIGVMYVGGFAGGTGIAACKQENITYRHPSTNEGSQPSQINRLVDAGIIRYVENTGVVLGIKRSVLDADAIITRQDSNIYDKYEGTSGQYWQEKLTDEPDSGVGGIVGIARLQMASVSNIQADKDYAIQLIGLVKDGNGNITNYDTVHDTSYYGGNGVGGIMGIGLSASHINKDNKNDISIIDAIVYGDDIVGGAIGSALKRDEGISVIVNRCVPTNAYIIGRDSVGGLSGYNYVKLNIATLNQPYTVYGRYKVGGITGESNIKGGDIGSNGLTVGTANKDDIKVVGKEKVGGMIGYEVRSNVTYKSVKLYRIKVEGEKFVGGVIGAFDNDLNCTFNFGSVQNEGLNVNATQKDNQGCSYAGGIVGMVPQNVTIRSASFYKGEIHSPSEYLGEITEINNGVITACRINTMSADSNKTYFGGLCGVNTNTVAADNYFDAKAELTGVKYLGGFVGLNRGNLQCTDINADTVKLKTTGKSDTAIGVLIGVNEAVVDINPNLQTKQIGKISGIEIITAEYAGSIAGVNKGTILSSAMNSVLSGQTGRDSNIRYNITDDIKKACCINANISVTDVTKFGAIAGQNKSIICDLTLCAYNDSDKTGFTFNTSNVQTVGGLVGENESQIVRCYNFSDISTGANYAAGIAGNLAGNSTIKWCDNYGNITAVNIAAGIAATSTDNGVSVFDDCINTGTMNTTGDGAVKAGIAGDTNGYAQYVLCRNYGKGVNYGITSDDGVSSDGGTNNFIIVNCLEASGLTEGDGSANPIAASDKSLCVRDFYIYDSFAENIANPGEGREQSVSTSQQVYQNIDYSFFVNTYAGQIDNVYYNSVSNYSSVLENIHGKIRSGENSFLRDFYDDFGKTNYKAGSVNAWPDSFKEVMYGLFNAYIYSEFDAQGNTNYSTWVADENNIAEFIAFIEAVKQSNSIPITGYTTTYTTGSIISPVPDNSAWPVQLWTTTVSVNGETKYTLCYKRFNSYYSCGLENLSFNPLDVVSGDATHRNELDQLFVAWVKDANNGNASENPAYPNYDQFDDEGTLAIQGFVKTP